MIDIIDDDNYDGFVLTKSHKEVRDKFKLSTKDYVLFIKRIIKERELQAEMQKEELKKYNVKSEKEIVVDKNRKETSYDEYIKTIENIKREI